MHLADGIVQSPVWLVGATALGVGSVALVARRLGEPGTRGVAFTGTLAAFVLAAQALNVPLLPGASAHVIGASLLTLAVGPARAVLALVAVLLVQALLLGDGGVSALGINALNIAVLPVLSVHVAARLLGPKRLGTVAVLGTLLGSTLGGASLATLLVFGAGFPSSLTYGWLVGVQALAGLGEGVLTALAIRHIQSLAPGMLAAARSPAANAPALLDDSGASTRNVGLAWAALAVALACALLPLASHTPDALERVVEHARPSP